MIKEQINTDLKNALKTGDALARSVLGMLKSAAHNKEIEKKKQETGLSDDEIMEVVRSEIKKRADAAAAFRTAGDISRAEGEEKESAILKKYLPPEANDKEIKKAVEKVFEAAGSRAKSDFGKLMGAAVKELKNRADGNRIKSILESMLE